LDEGAVDIGTVRELFLRQSLGLAAGLQILLKDLAYLHHAESEALSSVSPRTISTWRCASGFPGVAIAISSLANRAMTDVRFKDRAPDAPEMTDYDRHVAATYLRLLDAAADGIDWREVVAVLFGRDVSSDPEGALIVYESHLARARWITAQGYREIVWGKA